MTLYIELKFVKMCTYNKCYFWPQQSITLQK